MARTKPRFEMYLSKIPGFWTITGFPESQVVLRILVEYVSGIDPCDLFFEVASSDQAEFLPVGAVQTTLWSLAHPHEEDPDETVAYPEVWRREFRHMARRWAAAAWILDPGCSID
ncbi:MAG: hypothetical protein M3541_17605, partial [Acidobacteriota bacterium]|nr:hypothetical protein [Acidobacteriota bacterium]